MSDDLIAEYEAMLADIRERLKVFPKTRGSLIPILQAVQAAHSYLAPETIGLVAEHLEISPSDVYGVATFYNQFRFKPPGKHPIKVCLGTACHVKAADIILENFERKLEIAENETTEDREFSLERVACVGCCALAPVAVVGETVHGHMAPSKVEGLIMRIRLEKEMREKRKKNESSK
jgi:NADH-quinone oxidoreductase subunit E